MIEHSLEEMIGKISESSKKNPLFSQIVHDAVMEYYHKHPEKKGKYEEGVKKVNG